MRSRMKQNLVKSTYLVEGAFSCDNNIPRYQCVCCAGPMSSRGYGNTQKKYSKDLIKVSFTSKSSSSSSFRFQPTKSYWNFTNPAPQIGDTNMTCKYVTNPNPMYLLLCYFLSILYYVHILEFSIKSGKQGTSTLSLVQNRVRFFKKNLPKSTLAFKGGADMPFWAWRHTGTAHGGAPWWCEMVPSWSTGV